MATKKQHPGFKAVSKKIQKKGYTAEEANAILAAKTRAASATAKKKNPSLRKVK